MVVLAFNGWADYLVSRLGGRRRVAIGADGVLDDEAWRDLPFGGVVLLHFDLTLSSKVGGERDILLSRLAFRGLRVLNARVTDISKAKVSRLNAAAGGRLIDARSSGHPDDLLIIKTNLNSKATPERRISGSSLRALGYQPSDLPPAGFPKEYPVLRRADIPTSWWTHPGLRVQQYVEHPSRCFFRSYFVGRHHAISRGMSSAVVKRMAPGIDRRNWLVIDGQLVGNVPAGPLERDAYALSRRVAALAGLDFGTVDVQPDHCGRLSALDINPTPYWGAEYQPELVAHLARSIESDEQRGIAKRRRSQAPIRRDNWAMSNERARSFLRQAVPGLRVESLRKIGRGYARSAFVANEAILFKFPNDSGAETHLMREAWFCQHFSGKGAVRIPELAYLIPSSDLFPGTVVGLTLMPGRTIHHLYPAATPRTQAHIAEQIAEFLSIVHGAALPRQAQLLVHAHFTAQPTWRARAARVLDVPGDLSPAERRRVRSFLERWPAKRVARHGRPTLIHGDLWPDHLLVDQRAGYRLAVIDFGSAGFGDPDFDLAYLGNVDERLVTRVSELLGHAEATETAGKVDYFRLVTWLDVLSAETVGVLAEDRVGALRQLRDWLACDADRRQG